MFNCFLVREEDGCTLIDTNVGGSAGSILRASQQVGWPIRRILLTHAHFDHVASLDELSEVFPQVEVAIGAREGRFLEGDFSLQAPEQGKCLFGLQSVKTKVTRKLGDGEQLGSLRAVSSPGHTPGHFSYFDVRDNTLIAGRCLHDKGWSHGGRCIPLVLSYARAVFLEWHLVRSQRGEAPRFKANSARRWTREYSDVSGRSPEPGSCSGVSAAPWRRYSLT